MKRTAPLTVPIWSLLGLSLLAGCGQSTETAPSASGSAAVSLRESLRGRPLGTLAGSGLCGDFAQLKAGPYTYSNNTWGSGKAQGSYTQCLQERNVNGQNQIGWNWNWPGYDPSVFSYPEILFGWSPWGGGSSSDARFPMRIDGMPNVYMDFDVEHTATGRWDLAPEIWLTKSGQTGGANPGDIHTEMMFWLDYDNATTPAGNKVADANIDGKNYEVYQANINSGQTGWNYLTFKGPARTFSGRLNIDHFISFARERNLMPGGLFLSSIEFGDESSGGTGSTWVKNYAVGVGGSTPPPPPPPGNVNVPLDQYRSLQVTTPGYTNRFLRHKDGLARTDLVNTGSDALLKADATFKIVRGLADGNCYSFEARTFAGTYLRHKDFRVRIDKSDNSELFKNDATFCARTGLSGTGVSFESRNLPGSYLRHIYELVWLAQKGSTHAWDRPESFEQDVSWNIADGFAPDTGGSTPQPPAPPPPPAPVGPTDGKISADFTQGAPVNLVKMFGMFNSAFVTPDRWERDIVNAKNLAPIDGPLEIRWETPIGTEEYTGWERWSGRDLNRDCNSNNYGPGDRVFRAAQNNGVTLLPTIGYSPEHTGPVRPSDYGAWADKVAGCFTNHWKQFNNVVGYEIWNEPDLGPFGQFNVQQYSDVYNEAVRRISGKPVMGPSIAGFYEFGNWMIPFLDKASRLDTYTFHKYGAALEDIGAVNGIRDLVRGRGKQANLTEWNYKHGPFSKDKNQNSLLRLDGARELLVNLRDFASINQDRWLGKVHWAQLQEPGCVLNDDGCDRIGLMNVRGKRRPTYYAFQMYNKMPVSRKRLDVGVGIDGMATQDGDHTAVVLWNNEGRDKTIELAMNGAPSGTYYIYSVDLGSNSLKAATNGSGDIDGNNYSGDDSILKLTQQFSGGSLKVAVRDSAVVFVTNQPLPGL